MIPIKEITNGQHNGKKCWICDLRYNDYGDKPIRNIEPVEVLIRDNSETNKRIYYSDSHFVKLNKNGEPLKSKIYAPYDNTGYRSFAGTALSAFLTKEDCEKHYKSQIKIAIAGFKNYREQINLSISKLESKL